MNSDKRYKKIITSALLGFGALSMWSCHKNNNNAGAFTYEVNNVGDTAIAQGTGGVVYWKVNPLTGTQQAVNISISGLPYGIVGIASPSVGLAPFTTSGGFAVGDSITPGAYPYTVTTTTQGQADKTYSGNITVIDCVSEREGFYHATSQCYGVYTSNITQNSGSFHRINISNFSNLGQSIYADVYCSKDSLNIPSQIILSGGQSYTIAGHGRSLFSEMDISYSRLNNGSSFTCTDTLRR